MFGLGLSQARFYAPATRAIALDNQIYFYIAERVAAGVPPHVSLLDHKHALAAMLSGWSMLLGRMFGVDDVVSMRAVSIIAAAAMPPAVYVVARRLTGSRTVGCVAALTALGFDDFFSQGAAGVRPQVFMAAFLAQSFAALACGRSLLAGILSMAAFLCWQPALAGFASTTLALLVTRGNRTQTLRFVSGGIAVLLSYEAYFLAHGALSEQLFQAYMLRGNLATIEIPALADTLRFLLRDGRWGLGAAVLVPATYLAATAALAVIAMVRIGSSWRLIRSDPLPGAVFLTSTIALAFTFVDHQAYPDRFFLQPFIAIATGIVWGGLLAWLVVRVGGRAREPQFAGLVFVVWAVTIAATTRTSFPLNDRLTLARQRDLAERTYALSIHYGPVWAIGCPHILALDRTGNFDAVALVIDPKIQSYLKDRTGESGYRPARGMPAAMITSRGQEEKTLPWLRKEYWPVPDAPYNEQGIRVWLRKDCLVSRRKCTMLFECPGTPRCRNMASNSGSE